MCWTRIAIKQKAKAKTRRMIERSRSGDPRMMRMKTIGNPTQIGKIRSRIIPSRKCQQRKDGKNEMNINNTIH